MIGQSGLGESGAVWELVPLQRFSATFGQSWIIGFQLSTDLAATQPSRDFCAQDSILDFVVTVVCPLVTAEQRHALLEAFVAPLVRSDDAPKPHYFNGEFVGHISADRSPAVFIGSKSLGV